MKSVSFNLFISLVIFLFNGCNGLSQTSVRLSEEFNAYWYSGKAEISSYRLQQARYGEMREGEAALIYVTEPFSLSRQVKLDDPHANFKDHVSVLKLNFTKNFITGIYPYSMMSSTFTPVDIVNHPKTLKVSATIQEWCGNTFLQLNLRNKGYRISGYSYFETEGDISKVVPETLTEDGIWTLLRLNPESLPQGAVDLIPGVFYLRLKHQPLEPVRAVATLEELTRSEYADSLHRKYTLQYPERKLSIFFQNTFPYQVLGWEETYLSGFGKNAKEMTTKARLTKTMKSDYWTRNSNKDLPLREELGLDE